MKFEAKKTNKVKGDLHQFSTKRLLDSEKEPNVLVSSFTASDTHVTSHHSIHKLAPYMIRNETNMRLGKKPSLQKLLFQRRDYLDYFQSRNETYKSKKVTKNDIINSNDVSEAQASSRSSTGNNFQRPLTARNTQGHKRREFRHTGSLQNLFQ